MPTQKDVLQDDYYAHLSQEKDAGSVKKKPLKIIKKQPTSETSTPSASTEDTNKKPKIIVRKKESKETPYEEVDTPVGETQKPQARLVEREHASKGLLRSIGQKQEKTTKATPDQKKPVISFGAAPKAFKPLENRPVMPLPSEGRRAQRDDRRNNTPNDTNRSQGERRLRDDSKPIFQRDINFSTPVRDGTAKKGKGKKDYGDEAMKKKGLKSVGGDMDDGSFRRSKKVGKKKEKNIEEIAQVLVDRTGQEVAIGDMISVKEFSDKIGVPVAKIIGELMKNGVLVTLNAPIDFDTCFLVGEAFGINIIREISEEVSVSDLMDGNIEELIKEEDDAVLVERSPIVSVMGHVDHGKTSILDYIRNTTVAAGEAGGITQKIGAYQVTRNNKRVTFLDTPGHEAFTIMRARGAKLTDVAVIVVAADEGMKPQTIESIHHAQEAGVPIIIAANKMDKPGANLDLIRGQMAEHGLQPEDWGGTTVLVPVSAHTGLGIEDLLDMILLQSEVLDLKANPNRGAIATVIEANLDPKLGSVATILINTGTIRKGDNIVCAGASGKVRTLKDYKGRNVDEATPGMPVQITGLSDVVEGGDILQVVSSADLATARAKEFALARNKKSIHAFE